MMRIKSVLQTVIWGILFIGLAVGLIGLLSSASRSPTAASSPPVTTQPEDGLATPTSVLTASPTQVPTPALTPTVAYAVSGLGYPVTDTTPGGITILSKGEVIVIPNPVSSAPSDWKIYKDPFYTYTVAYPPEWFLTAPPPDAIEKAYAAGAKVVLGLGPSISSVDTSKGPGTEPRTLNPQDALRIDITVEDAPLHPGESLKDFMARQSWYWADNVKAIEETEYKGHPALVIHGIYQGIGDTKSTGLLILIADKSNRVFRIAAGPDPQDTIYPDVFKQILDSFTILEQ